MIRLDTLRWKAHKIDLTYDVNCLASRYQNEEIGWSVKWTGRKTKFPTIETLNVWYVSVYMCLSDCECVCVCARACACVRVCVHRQHDVETCSERKAFQTAWEEAPANNCNPWITWSDYKNIIQGYLVKNKKKKWSFYIWITAIFRVS